MQTTYLVMYPEGLFELDITAFADPLHLVVEAWILIPDLMLGASAAYLVVAGLIAVAYPSVVASVQAEIESVIIIVAVMPEVGTDVLEPVTSWMDSDVVAEPWIAA